MKPEVLEKIKRDYLNIQDEYKTYYRRVQRLEMLEQHPLVQEYLQLKEELATSSIAKTIRESRLDSAARAFAAHAGSIKVTNYIFVCLGTYIDSAKYDNPGGSGNYQVEYNHLDAEYRIYADIEKPIFHSIKIPISFCSEFEKTHRIIYLKKFYSECEFYDLQDQFFLDAIEVGQEEAIKRVLAKSKN